MQRYESYKPSGVEWLGEIPSHWDVKRNIGVFDERKESNQANMELLSVTINRGIIKQDEITAKKDSSNEDKSKYKVVRKDDLAYNKMRMWQGAIGASDYDGIVSPAYIVLRPRDTFYSRYFHYLYRTEAFIAEANRHSYGLCLDMNSLRYEDFKTIYSPVPPQTDVERIVNFLDQKTAEIDAATAKKQWLIELLQEQKSILINQAVTRGLNPNVVMRESEVEWIGEVPAHWERYKLKRCINLLPGFAFKSNQYSMEESDIPLLRGVNINPGKVNWEETVYWPATKIDSYSAYLLKEGDLVIGMDRPWVTDGIRVARIRNKDLPCLLLQRVARIRAKKKITQGFLEIVLTSRGFLNYFEPMLTGISVPHISPDQIGNFEVNLPPIIEQENICAFVKTITETSNKIIASEEKARDKLLDLRIALISEVVTGNIKV
ncbi:restriction endonuclease subunit S [Methylomonas sp. AM2-LC]|uniref:restriction endonuclease subunit S n=1 Tax=Methylomonas sp. AM2-LC TaxID=3153301 RepID=UPI0032679D60